MAQAGVAAALAPLAAGAAEASRPNIVFITTDDQRWDAMSGMGHPFVRTPNMDRLAREGMRFAEAFVTISLCAPSRACYLTGAYAHTHGVRTNEGSEIGPGTPTFAQALQRSGYETAFLGKWHQAPRNNPRPGFDYWFSFTGQGVYVDPEVNENGRTSKVKGYMTDILTDRAVAWLEKSRQRPFCLCLWHKAVHGPFTPAPRHESLYADAELPKPASFDDTLEGKPAWQRAVQVRGQQRAEWLKNRNTPVPDRLPPQKWDGRRKSMLDYFRALAAVDESIGRVLATLEATGRLDNTIIVFASDNGYFHGEHRRGDKRLAYEEALRVPLLVRYPRAAKAGSVCNDMALNIDLAPTLLDFAGAKTPASVQGRSLRPLLEGRTPGDWRQEFFYEYFQERGSAGLPTMLAVRTKQWKYVTYPDLNDIDELYDLRNDPREMKNLALDGAHRKTLDEMKAELERLKRETGYTPMKPREPQVYAGAPQLVLHYTFDDDDPQKALDRSGKGNDGAVVAAPIAEGRVGKARRFDGRTSHIKIAKSASLNPANAPFTVAAWIESEAPDGVVLARGGQSIGYWLGVQEGRPVFLVRESGELVEARGEASVAGRWVHLAASLTKDAEMILYVDGKVAARKPATGLPSRDPVDVMEIGADLGSPVGDTKQPFYFRGRIADVRLYRGELPAGEIAKLAVAK
jgi:N-acetylglucosamine-6-sulfatase